MRVFDTFYYNLAKLAPYLDEPEDKNRSLIFDAGEWETLQARTQKHCTAITERIRSAMPKSINPSAAMHDAEQYAKTALLDKIFRGTGYEKQKGNPSWLSCYTCTDQNGCRYEAYIQRVSSFGEFRLWLEIEGSNFTIREQPFPALDYAGTDPETTKLILTKFAALCVSLREEYAPLLLEDFGITPAWFRQ